MDINFIKENILLFSKVENLSNNKVLIFVTEYLETVSKICENKNKTCLSPSELFEIYKVVVNDCILNEKEYNDTVNNQVFLPKK